MDELMNMVISDESPSEISSKIKEILQVKSVEKIDQIRPHVASQLFGSDEGDE